jgi:hypothetical protein
MFLATLIGGRLARVPLSNVDVSGAEKPLGSRLLLGPLGGNAVTTVDHRYEGNASDHLPVVVTLRGRRATRRWWRAL